VNEQRNAKVRSAAASAAPSHLTRQLWVLFWLLAILQAADLFTTYLALETGAVEGNPAFRGLLFTPAAPLLKIAVLIFFAMLIIRGTTRGRPTPEHLLIATRLLAVVYLAIVGNNILIIARFIVFALVH